MKIFLFIVLAIISMSVQAVDPFTSIFEADDIDSLSSKTAENILSSTDCSTPPPTGKASLIEAKIEAFKAIKNAQAKAEEARKMSALANAVTGDDSPEAQQTAKYAAEVANKAAEEAEEAATAAVEALDAAEATAPNIKLAQIQAVSDCSLEKGFIQRLEFAEEDEGVGGLSVSGLEGTQKVKLNALNYRLWFGGEYYLPFQIFASHTASTEPTDEERAEAINADALLDPESGIAVSVPFLWRYKGSGKKLCHFIDEDKSELGFCTFGGKIVGHFKNLETLDGESKLASGITAELGASALFPIFEAKENKKAGYLAIGFKLLHARTDIDDPSQLFTPLTNAEGEPIEFKKSISSQQFGLKLALDKTLAIGATWTKPFDNEQYIGENLSISLETQF